jgi:serine protease AprX
MSAPAGAQEGSSKVDSDGDKIYNDLDDRIEGKADSSRVDVIAVFSGGTSEQEAAEAKRAVGSFDVTYEYETISAVAAEMSVGQIKALAKRTDTVQIQLDAPMTSHMDTARASSGVDASRTDFGVDGNNQTGACPDARSYCADDVTVAIIDTGIHAAHADLNGGKVIGFANCLNTTTCSEVAPFDDNGHGTHVASMVAGEGDGSTSRALAGVAPGAALVGVKVLGSSGSGSTSGVDAGVEWVIANKTRFGIEVLNMSLGSSTPSSGTDSTSRVVNRAAANGITPFVSAGNSGPGRNTIGSPGAAKFAVTVGAMADPQDNDGTRPPGFSLASFSSRGPTADGRVKPDIAAPGVDISAAAAGTTTGYSVKSGTSMSSPFAAGVGALVLDADPSLGSSGSACLPSNTTGDCADGVIDSSMLTSLKNDLTGTAIDWGPAGNDNEYGAGRLAPYAAIDAASPLTGAGDVSVPTHTFGAGSLAGTGTSALHSFPVSSTDAPIAITFVMPTWSGSSTPDFDIYLLNPSGTQVAKSDGTTRQETIGFRPTVTGTWTLRVLSYAGSGSYWFDASFPGAPVEPPEPNTVPIAAATSASTSEDGAVSVALSGTDAETCDLTFSVVSAPAHGTLGPISNAPCSAGDPNADSATVTYSPHANYNGSDSFTYRVGDGQDNSTAATAALTVAEVNDLPLAGFTSSCSGLACNFTDTSTDVDGSVASWAWTFGDGSDSSERSPSHTYAAAGTYTVTLTATDDKGGSGSTSRTVTVSAGDTTPPSAPSALTASSAPRRISLSWQSATDTGGSGLAGYEIYRSSTGAAGSFVMIATTTSTSFTNSGLDRRATYWYYVIAFDGADNRSGPSNTVSAQTR